MDDGEYLSNAAAMVDNRHHPAYRSSVCHPLEFQKMEDSNAMLIQIEYDIPARTLVRVVMDIMGHSVAGIVSLLAGGDVGRGTVFE